MNGRTKGKEQDNALYARTLENGRMNTCCVLCGAQATKVHHIVFKIRK